MNNDTGFLSDLIPRRWSPGTKDGLHPLGLFIGQGSNSLEVVVARSRYRPSQTTLLHCWKTRRKRRAAPVLLVVLHGKSAYLCGAAGEKPPHSQAEIGQAENLCREALRQPDRHAALRLLNQALPSLETELPGIRNEGLVALQELKHGRHRRETAAWDKAQVNANRALDRPDCQGEGMLEALGFQIEKLDNLTNLLKSQEDHRTALAVMLREDEAPETGTDRFNDLSPVSYALTKADKEGLRWVVLVQGKRLRLYAAEIAAGVGRRGRTEAYIECQPFLLFAEHRSYFWLLFSAEALSPKGSLQQILEDSKRFSGNLAQRLRERIYNEVIPCLAQGIAQVRNITKPSPEELERTYQMALTTLFRLLFIAYAEDRDLLPYQYNEAYKRRSLKETAKELARCIMKDTPLVEEDTHWQEFLQLCKAVEKGNPAWGVPAYNGGLFSDNPQISKAGAELASISLPNSIFEKALRILLVTQTPEGDPGPVDFRSLGVREFGTIYEGLLESELALAETDLALGKKDIYVPTRKGQTAAVHEGEIYLHNRSGARKSSGSYYTQSFAVEHLLESALKPALNNHFTRLKEMNDSEAAEAFFDFRVADIAMGSGHFLVSAIDHIEKAMADFLDARPLPGVRRELEALRRAAKKELGEIADIVPIEDGQLLRRLIARRCIYGVDLNKLAVQLTRLAVWIHTFVSGLPLSFLDHNLVHGNSLIGIGTFEELHSLLDKRSSPLFFTPEELLGKAKPPLKRLANLNDTNLQDIIDARQAEQEVQTSLSKTRDLFDLLTAQPISDEPKVTGFSLERWAGTAETSEIEDAAHRAQEELKDLHILHFPIVFPEVFLRKQSGFDVILGNPPWDKVKVEEDAFWARHFPGLRGLNQSQQEAEKERLRHERPDLARIHKTERKTVERLRKTLVNSGSYPGIGTGDPDLYKAFCWRFWCLVPTEGGHIGVVLPRNALATKGSEKFRKTIFEQSEQIDITTMINNRRWIFPEVHAQYSIGLMCITRGRPAKKSIYLHGPFTSKEEFDAFGSYRKKLSAKFSHSEVMSWNDTASLPLLPNQDSFSVFTQLRKAPRLDLDEGGGGGGGVASSSQSRNGFNPAKITHGIQPPGQCWQANPVTELHSTAQKNLMSFTKENRPAGYWPVYKGASFDLWNPDTGNYYAWADPKLVIEWLQQRRLRAYRNKKSIHRGFPFDHLQDISTLPCFAPRVAFRDVARSTDTRTVIAALIPPEVFSTSTGPYFLWPQGDEKDQAFLLGVLSSIPLDWYARRYVETHVCLFIIKSFPIPRPERSDVRWQRIVELAGRLACPDDRFSAWAKAVDVKYGPVDEDEKEDMIYELDAVVAHLYGLKEKQLVHIFETFHKGWDPQQRLERTLEYFHAWRNR